MGAYLYLPCQEVEFSVWGKSWKLSVVWSKTLAFDVSDGLVCMWLYILGCVIDFVKMDVGIRSCHQNGCWNQVLSIVLADL